MSGLEAIYYMFTKPTISIRNFQESKPVGWAFFIVLLAAISTNVGGVLISPTSLDIDKVVLSFGLLGRIILMVGIWVVGTAIIHLFAEWLDGEGKASILFIALGFCFLPAILVAPFALLIQNYPQTTKFLLFLSFNLIILLWIVKLEIMSIKEIYNISNFKAIMAISTPVALGILGITSFILISLLMAFSIGSSFLPPHYVE